ncbi:MAG: cytochrome c [Alphaproteobacteria bacterium]|nr:cytochrome c [Alphaproteobacteria bacterium]
MTFSKRALFLLFLLILMTSHLRSQTYNKGKKIYQEACLSCHQEDGGGVMNLNPPLDGASNVISNNTAYLIKVVLLGLKGKVALDNKYYGNVMAPHNNLSNQEIADVLNYIRNSWSNKKAKAKKILVEDVEATRKSLP